MGSDDVAGYLVMCDTSEPGGVIQATALMPAYVYPSREVAHRERARAQAHADLDADIDGTRYSYWIGEVRRVPAH